MVRYKQRLNLGDVEIFMKYDYIIIGAGSAGCVLLAASVTVQILVLLIEAGRKNNTFS